MPRGVQPPPDLPAHRPVQPVGVRASPGERPAPLGPHQRRRRHPQGERVRLLQVAHGRPPSGARGRPHGARVRLRRADLQALRLDAGPPHGDTDPRRRHDRVSLVVRGGPPRGRLRLRGGRPGHVRGLPQRLLRDTAPGPPRGAPGHRHVRERPRREPRLLPPEQRGHRRRVREVGVPQRRHQEDRDRRLRRAPRQRHRGDRAEVPGLGEAPVLLGPPVRPRQAEEGCLPVQVLPGDGVGGRRGAQRDQRPDRPDVEGEGGRQGHIAGLESAGSTRGAPPDEAAVAEGERRRVGRPAVCRVEVRQQQQRHDRVVVVRRRRRARGGPARVRPAVHRAPVPPALPLGDRPPRLPPGDTAPPPPGAARVQPRPHHPEHGVRRRGGGRGQRAALHERDAGGGTRPGAEGLRLDGEEDMRGRRHRYAATGGSCRSSRGGTAGHPPPCPRRPSWGTAAARRTPTQA
mmetsp:Transcript_21742/g.51218  ORF Transcript_21742/g.51218 Transcript_21742/m.51218 type:complete len:460 (-) Transcript_21742:1161-2540(-)